MISRLITIILAVLLCGSVAHAQQGIRWSQQQLAATGSKDISYILQSLNTALETTAKGNETRWHNPATGSYGVIIPLSHTVKVIPLSKIEKTCRVYHRTRVSDGQTMAYEGMAYREPDGWWQISEERQVPLTSVARAPKPTTQTEPPTIRSSQELTAETQTLLTQLGYNPGPVDGIFGSKTKSSIQAFQRQQGLPEDGRVSQVLVARLQEAVTVSAPTSTQQQNAAKQELINALEELDWAITDKINHDVQTIAQAFSDAYDIERSRRLADFVNAPLTVIEQAIGVRAFFKNFAEIISNIGRAESVLEVASLLMGIAQLQEVGENFQLALDGPAYSSLVDAMLEEAATSSVPGEYATTVKLHIGGIGGKKSPVGVRAPLSQRSSGLVWGTRTVKRLIKKQIAQFVEQLSGEELAASDVIAPILVHLTDVIRAIKKSRIANVAVLAGGPNTPRFDSIRLGSVGALEHVRSVALDAYDKNMQMLQSVVITSAIKAGSQAVTLSVAYKTPMGKLIGQAEREVFTPVSVYQTTLSKTYETNARDSVNGLPHEMLLALPAELSNTWTIIDDTLNSIRNALKTRDQLAAEREEVPPPAAEPRAAEEFFLGRVPTDSTMENGGWIGVPGEFLLSLQIALIS